MNHIIAYKSVATGQKSSPQGTLAVTTGSLARRVPLQIIAPGFYAKCEVAPDKLDAILALVGDSILAAHAERTKEDAAKPENDKLTHGGPTP